MVVVVVPRRVVSRSAHMAVANRTRFERLTRRRCYDRLYAIRRTDSRRKLASVFTALRQSTHYPSNPTFDAGQVAKITEHRQMTSRYSRSYSRRRLPTYRVIRGDQPRCFSCENFFRISATEITHWREMRRRSRSSRRADKQRCAARRTHRLR